MNGRTAIFSLFILVSACLTAWTDVTYIREVPQTGAPEIEAQWSKSPPQPQVQIAGRRTELAGRLAAGGHQGRDIDGQSVLDWFTDSNLTLLQPLGVNSYLQITALGVRRNRIDSFEQNYELSFGLLAERWTLDIAGAWEQQKSSATEVLTNDGEYAVDASISTTMIETLPMTLSYRHNWLHAEENQQATKDAQQDTAEFTASGILGSVELDLASGFEREYEESDDTAILGFDGSAAVTVPVTHFLKVSGSLASGFTSTVYNQTGNEVATTNLESGLGLIFPLSEELELKVTGGHIDTWLKQQGPDADAAAPSYLPTWKTGTAVDWQAVSGLFSAGSYDFSKTIGENSTQNAVLSFGYRDPRDGWLRESSLGGSYTLTLDDKNRRIGEAKSWTALLSLAPSETVTVSTDYEGGAQGVDENTWDHRLSGLFTHAPDPWLDYEMEAGLHSTYGPEATDVLKQEYRGRLNFNPQSFLRIYSFWLEENLGFARYGYGNEILSKAVYGMAIPVLQVLSMRYSIEWEWIDQTAAEAEGGNNFRHNTGFTITGEPLPLSLTADYAFSHGYRGLRHDVVSQLTVPLGRGYTVQGSATFSSYEEDGESQTPYLVGLFLSYAF